MPHATAREITIANRYPRLRLDRAALIRAIRTLDTEFPKSRSAPPTSKFPSCPPGELSLVFLTDPALAELHGTFLDDPTITDVITFEGDPAHGTAGEICISVDAALRQTAPRAKPPSPPNFSFTLSTAGFTSPVTTICNPPKTPYAPRRSPRPPPARPADNFHAALKSVSFFHRVFPCIARSRTANSTSMSVTSSLPNTESRLVTFRNAFISGALLLAPLIVTVWAFAQIIALVGGTVRPLF